MVSTVRNEMNDGVVATFAMKRLDAPEPVVTELRMMKVSVNVRVKFVLE
jgi:hypothetical protein